MIVDDYAKEARNYPEPQESSFRTQKPTRIYPVTEGIQSDKTAATYVRYFYHFLNHIKIHDLQVLLDFSPKVIKQMLIDYVLYLTKRNSLKVRLRFVFLLYFYFFRINNDDFFNLSVRTFRIHLPSDDKEVVNEDRPYTKED